jgi:ketosteroid isomerase-like protein
VDNVALAHAVYDAAQAGDQALFLSYFAPDCVVWHNFDQVEQPIKEAAAALAAMAQHFSSLTYEERRYIPAPDGAVIQHVSRATLKDGRTVSIPTMQRMYISNGRIRRIEEYFDTRAASAAMGG